MITTLLAAATFATASPDFAETNITGATIFRNGYGFVVTETWLDPSGTTYIKALPQAVEGTLWFAPGKYAEIKDITVTYMDIEPVIENAQTIPEIIALNIGKSITISLIKMPDQELEVLSGKIISVTRGNVLIQSEDSLRSISFGTIQSLSGNFDDYVTTAETLVSAPVLKVNSVPNSGGTIYTISLIEGITWVPAYNIDLSEDNKLSLSMKATIHNSIGNFEKIDVGLMSGFPKIDNLGSRDPLTAGLQTLFKSTENNDRLVMVKGQQTYGGANFGGGGFGGGGGGGFGGGGFANSRPGMAEGVGLIPEGITSVSYDPSDNTFMIDGLYDKRFRELDQSLQSVERENFFIYGIEAYEHKRGDRKYLVIDDGDLEYELSHRVSTSSSNSTADAARYVVFDNGLDVPLTRASVMITRGGELIGKTTVPYTYMGDKVELDIGKAPYLKTTTKSNLIRLNKGKIKLRDKRIFDEAKLEDEITLKNLSDRTIKVVLQHRLTGEVFDVSPRAVESQTSLSDSVNFDYLLEWEVELAAGESKTFKIEYSSYRFAGTDK